MEIVGPTLKIEAREEVRVIDVIVCVVERRWAEAPRTYIAMDHFPMTSIALTWPPGLARAPSFGEVNGYHVAAF